MASRGRTLVRTLLIALAMVSSSARADDWPVLEMPACDMLDVESVRGLLLVEVGGDAMRGITLRVHPDACAVDGARASFSIHDDEGLRAEGSVPLEPVETRERALALALAERLRLFAARREVRSVVAPPIDPPPGAVAPASTIAEPDASVRTPSTSEVPPAGPVPLPRFTLDACATGRLLPIQPSWTLGGAVGARFVPIDPLWIGLDLGASGTTGGVSTGTVDVWLLAAAFSVGLETRLSAEVSFEGGSRVAAILAHATGWPIDGRPPLSTTQPIVTLEALGAFFFWIDPHVALGLSVSTGAVLLGLTVQEATGRPIDLSGLLLGAALGVRIAP